MVLVSPDVLASTSHVKERPPSSESVTRTRLDQELKVILDRTDLNSYDKLQMYNQVLQRYLTFYNRTAKSPTIKTKTIQVTSNHTQAEPTSPQDQDNHIDDDDQHVLTPDGDEDKASKLMVNFPITLKKKANTLLGMIKRSKGVLDFNSEGEIIVDDHVISGSHISDLIYDVLLGKSNLQPKGTEQFLKALARMNVPERLIRNKTRRAALRRMKHVTPPKKNPKLSYLSKKKRVPSKPKPKTTPKKVGHLNWESYM